MYSSPQKAVDYCVTVFENNRSLLDGFRRGDAEALTQVYHFYVDRVALLVQRGFTSEGQGAVWGLYNPQIECELVQEVFAKAFTTKARQSYDGLRPYRPYLLRITKNLLIDYWRRQGREVGLPDQELDSLLEPAPVAKEEEMTWAELLKATQSYVQQLDPSLQNFVNLRFEQELSQYDLKKELKVSRWKIRSMEKKVQNGLLRFLRARKLLDGSLP